MNYVNEWESKGCDPDICIYGTFCNPCLFGQNSEHVSSYPGCVKQSLAVCTMCYTFNITGLVIDSLCFSGNLLTSSALSLSFAGFSNFITSAYTSDTRSKIRDKYKINGSDAGDFFCHFFCLPCAVCREAQEIRHMNNKPPLWQDDSSPILPPSTQSMNNWLRNP